MTLKDFLKWSTKLPKDFWDYEIVASKMLDIDEEYTARLDMPVVSLSVDESNKEIVIEVLKDKTTQ